MNRSKRIVRLFNEQAGLCAYCTEPMQLGYGKWDSATVDHIVPKSQGGKGKQDNCAAVHYQCNMEKGSKSLLVYLLGRNPLVP